MHSVKRILTTENRTCAIRPTAIHVWLIKQRWLKSTPSGGKQGQDGLAIDCAF